MTYRQNLRIRIT